MRHLFPTLCHFFSRTLTVLVCIGAVLPLPAAAQDGTLRQRFKERLQQRQQERDPAAALDLKPGKHALTLKHDGLVRKYLVQVPASYKPSQPAALLVALHGGGGSMDYMADDNLYGLISKSEREGFVVVFPNGYSSFPGGKLATWNAGHCCGQARDKAADDVGFIRQMVENLQKQLTIDPLRIFATGMSNGAMMSYRLACEMADVFKGIAAVAGTDNTRECQPAHPVPVLHIHAKNDDHVLFGGGAGPASVKESAVTNFISVPATVSKWAQINGCSAAPQRVLDRPAAYCERYSPCQGKAAVQLCVTDTGGHSWPGGSKPRGNEPPSQALSAVDVMWDFFRVNPSPN